MFLGGVVISLRLRADQSSGGIEKERNLTNFDQCTSFHINLVKYIGSLVIYKIKQNSKAFCGT